MRLLTLGSSMGFPYMDYVFVEKVTEGCITRAALLSMTATSKEEVT